MQLDLLDWTIIVAYFVITLVVGVAYTRRAGSSLAEYFVSGRSLPWWIAGTSMVATTFAADTPLAVTGLVVKYGLAGNWFWWAFGFGGMFTVFVYSRLWRRAEVMTDVELIELRYSGNAAATLRLIRALYIALLVNPIIIGWVTNAMVTVLQQTVLYSEAPSTLGNWTIIVSCLAVVGVYCTISGMWGVALTDFIQFFLAMVGCTALAFLAVKHVHGVEGLREQVAASFGDPEQAFAFLPSFNSQNVWMPWNSFAILLLVHWWATWYPGAEPGGGGYIVQRMAACKDEKHSLLATLWYQIAFFCVRPWPWLMVAFAALAIHPELRTKFLADSQFDPGIGYPMVMRELAPSGLRGLLLVTFFAAFMSTISTQMNWGASYLVRDVFQRFVAPDASERTLTNASRVASVLVLITGAIAAKLMENVHVDQAWKALAALGAGTGAVFMLRWFWWRISAWTEIAAMLSSLVFFYFVIVGDAPGMGIHVATEEMRTLLVAVLTIATWLLVTFITPPEKDETLVKFYRKVRPGGVGWGPIRALAPDVIADRHLGLSILAAMVAAGIVYFTLPGVGLLIFGQWGRGLLCLGGAGISAVVVYFLLSLIGWKNIV
ncbi:MAG: sodium:solute symporter family protein [Pirellulaceae bacterium]